MKKQQQNDEEEIVLGKCYKCKKTVKHSDFKNKLKMYRTFQKLGICTKCQKT
jgi:acetyl-CoA carboxylase beta subunit